MLWIIWRLKPDIVGTLTVQIVGRINYSLYNEIKVRVRYRHVSTTIRKTFSIEPNIDFCADYNNNR